MFVLSADKLQKLRKQQKLQLQVQTESPTQVKADYYIQYTLNFLFIVCTA